MSDESHYLPDDSRVKAETLVFLHSAQGAGLLGKVAGLGTPGVAEVSRLRQDYSAEQVHAALAVGHVQGRAREKFPELADGIIWALPEALEQATDSAVARHKAARFKAARAKQIIDLCCGIGGDALALATVAPTLAVDLSRVRLLCLEFNASRLGIPIETAALDVQTASSGEIASRKTADGFFHLDPARRSAGKRSAAYQDLIPGPASLQKIMAKFRGGALKISSATVFDDLPVGHLELISHNRVVVQAVLWVGELGEMLGIGKRTATTIVNHVVTASFTGVPAVVQNLFVEMPPVEAILYEADGALTRSDLAATLAKEVRLESLTDDAGYLLSLSGSVARPHPALTAFRVLATTHFSPARVIKMLQSLPPAKPGAVEVKTRGRIRGVDTDELQTAFSKASPFQRTVLIYRRGNENVAVAAMRDPIL